MTVKTPRSSPSGPLYNVSGHRIRGSFANSTISPSYTFPGTGAQVEVKTTPTDALAPFMRAQLLDCSLSRRYRIRGSVPLRALSGWLSAVALPETRAEVSIDDGTNWIQMGFARVAMNGSPASVQTGVNATFLGSDVAGLVEGGTLLARLTQSEGGAATANELSFNSIGNAAQCSIELEEEEV